MLIVYAHQSSKSFNASAKEAAKKTLEAKGCAVEVSDLYALLSKGVVGKCDVSQMTPAVNVSASVCLTLRAAAASADDAKPLDILEEQRKLEKADLVVFQVV